MTTYERNPTVIATTAQESIKPVLEVHVFGRQVTVEETGNEVILRGVVKSYYLKQLAQENARRQYGDRQIVNLLEVR